MRLTEIGLDGLAAVAPEWDALAARAGNPFLTTAWLESWGRAFAADDSTAFVLSDAGGAMLAGGCFVRERGGWAAAANGHSNDWDVVAVDDEARAALWARLAANGAGRLTAALAPATTAAATRAALGGAGYRVVEQPLEPSPWMELPGSIDELLRGRSRNLRSQVGRRRRALEREGGLAFRVTTGGADLERDLERFLAVEASGWKGRSGTAIAASEPTEALYRQFAAAAARAGWLRLYLLELDGETIAADYGCVFGGCGYLVKTGFREQYGHLAPGLVLRAEVVAASIDEGLDRYDFLGGPDSYKLRWTDDLRARVTLRAFRGVGTAPALAWWGALRPGLKTARDRGRRALGRDDG